MKFQFLKALLVSTSLAASIFARAGLINTDYLNQNDGLLVLDSGTGYEWATITDNMKSIDQFNSLSIFANQGFIIAGIEDLRTLIINAGGITVNNGPNHDINNVPAAQLIRGLFKHSVPTHTGGNKWIHGLYDNQTGGYDTMRVAHPYYDDGDDGGFYSFTLGDTNFIDVTSSYQRSYISVWAYRVSAVNVPEPSTITIFALGMIGLASRRLKKQS